MILRIAARVMAEGSEAAVVDGISPFVARLSGNNVDPIAKALQDRLAAAVWWADDAAAEQCAATYRLAKGLCAPDAPVTEAIEGVIQDDFARIERTQAGELPTETSMLATGQGLRAVCSVAPALPPRMQSDVRDRVGELVDADKGDVRAAAACAVVALTSSIADGEGSAKVPQADKILAALPHDEHGRAAVVMWLSLEPDPATVAALASRVRGSLARKLRGALAGWADGVDTGLEP